MSFTHVAPYASNVESIRLVRFLHVLFVGLIKFTRGNLRIATKENRENMVNIGRYVRSSYLTASTFLFLSELSVCSDKNAALKMKFSVR